MSDDSKIEWTDATWNPIRGCSRVSEGCRRCYAESVAARFSGPGLPYDGLVRIGARGKPTGWNGVVRMVPEHLADPLRWRRPRRIFVNSMSDLFHERLTNEQIAAVFGVMAAAPHHTFQVLTKRAARMRAWFEWVGCQRGQTPRSVCSQAASPLVKRIWDFAMGDRSWPLPNVWLGVSVENQAAADERIPELLRTPAAVRWISAEPLLGLVDLTMIRDGSWYDTEGADLYDATTGHAYWRNGDHGLGGGPRLDWIVAGCESGHGARPCDVAWLRSLRDQCAAAGVAFFLKQAIGTPGVGVVAPSTAPHEIIKATSTVDRTRFTDAITAGPGSHRKAGGVIGLPYLDGVQHAAMPEVAS